MHFKTLKSQALQPDLPFNTRVIHLHKQNYSSKKIGETLKEEDIITNSRAVQRLIKIVRKI